MDSATVPVFDQRVEIALGELLNQLPRPRSVHATRVGLPLVGGEPPRHCPLYAAARDVEGVTFADGVVSVSIMPSYSVDGTPLHAWGCDIAFDVRTPHTTYVDPSRPIAPQVIEWLAEVLLHLTKVYVEAGLIPDLGDAQWEDFDPLPGDEWKGGAQ